MNETITFIKQLFGLLIFAGLFLSALKAQTLTSASTGGAEKKVVEYFGKLSSEPVPDTTELYGMVFDPVTDKSRFKFRRIRLDGTQIASD